MHSWLFRHRARLRSLYSATASAADRARPPRPRQRSRRRAGSIVRHRGGVTLYPRGR